MLSISDVLWPRPTLVLYVFNKNDVVNFIDPTGLQDFASLTIHRNKVPYVISLNVGILHCPNRCGRDYTQFINAEIKRLRSYLAEVSKLYAYSLKEEKQESLRSYLMLGPEAALTYSHMQLVNQINFLNYFRKLALSLNYAQKVRDSQKRKIKSNPFAGCPTVRCSGTMTLCAKCVTVDVPGNVLYGFISEGLGIPIFLQNLGAHAAEFSEAGGEEWPIDRDIDVYPLGRELFRSGSNDICTVINKLPSRYFRSKCEPCRCQAETSKAVLPSPPNFAELIP